MKIIDIKIHQPVGLLRIIADNGHEGWCLNVNEPTAKIILATYRDHLVGQDPLNIERMWQQLVHLDRFAYPPGSVRGHIDVALWDLAGKTAGVPIYKLIGGFRDRIPCYKSGHFMPNVDDYVKDAVQAKQEGFFGYKDHCYLGVEGMIEVAKAVRQAVGPDFYLMHDSVQHYTYPQALKVARELERQDYFWFEEPLRDYDIIGLKKLSDAVDVPIAAAEFLPGTIYSTSQLLAQQAVDIVRASVPWRGGITDMIKIARLAEAFGVQCEITSSGIIQGFVHAHVIGAIKNCTFFEAWSTGSVGGEPLIKNPRILEDAHLPVPQSPGLGLDLDCSQIDAQTQTIMQ